MLEIPSKASRIQRIIDETKTASDEGRWIDIHKSMLIDEIERLREALKEIAKYETEEGCQCSACEHAKISRAALKESE